MVDSSAEEIEKSFNRVLSGLGVLKAYRELPANMREHLQGRHFPKLTIQLDGGLTEQTARAPKAELEEALRSMRFPGSPLGAECFLQDYFATAIALALSFRAVTVDPSSLAPQMIRLDKAILRLLDRDVIAAGLQALFWGLDNVLIKHNRIDKQILWVSLETLDLPDGRPQRNIILHREDPKTVVVTLDGHPRRAFRCGQCFGPDGFIGSSAHSVKGRVKCAGPAIRHE